MCFLLRTCLLLSVLLQIVAAQNCISADCSVFSSIYYSCDANPGTANPLRFVSCLCEPPGQFEDGLRSCYACEQTLFQTTIAGFGLLLNVCDTASLGPATTSSIGTSTIQTFTIVGATSTSASPSQLPATSTSITTPAKSDGHRLICLDWVYLGICNLATWIYILSS